MGFLAAGIGALGSLAGSVIGANAQKAAASTAADAQNNMLQQQLAYLQKGQADSRNAISGMLPYAQGASQAAAGIRGNVPFLAPGQGHAFGGQQVQATPTGAPGMAGNGIDYSSLLAANQPGNTQMTGGGFLGGASLQSNGTQQNFAPQSVANPFASHGGFLGGMQQQQPGIRYTQGGF